MERRKGLDFIRAISAIGIIAFHFYCHSSSEGKLFLFHANGTWGGVLNYLFFMLSGLVLHSKYGKMEKLNLGEFYYKRWKAMMPAYLIVFAYAYGMNVLTYGKFFYMDIPNSRILLTMIGLDGYFSWITPTYFITGEWFLGAIIMAYIVYPLLRSLMAKNKILVFIALVAAYLAILRVEFFGLPQAVNPATFLLCFYIGMLLSSASGLLDNLGVIVAAGLASVVLLVVPIPTSNITMEILIALALLFVGNQVGEKLCRNALVYKAVFFISSMSFYTFVIHHQIIYKVLGGFDSTGTGYSLVILAGIILVTLLLAYILSIVMNALFSSRVFRRVESALTKHF